MMSAQAASASGSSRTSPGGAHDPLLAVTFDMWGTIAQNPPSNALLRVSALQSRLPGVSALCIQRAYDGAFADAMGACDRGWGLPPATVLSNTLLALGVTLSPPDYALVLRQWEEAPLTDPPALTPGLAPTLRHLRHRGLLIGLISDTGVTPGRINREVLVRAGLRSLFDWITFSNETGISKRNPLQFALTLRALGVPPGKALHVGDQLGADIQGARAAGLRTALTLEWSDRRDAMADADIVLDHLSDLPGALARRGW